MPTLVLRDYDSYLSRVAAEKPSDNHRFGRKIWLRNLFIALVMLFLFLPIFILVAFSFNASKMNIIFTGFTLEWYERLFENENLLDAFKNTLLIAGISTTVSTILGTISAVGMKKYSFFSKKLVDKLIISRLSSQKSSLAFLFSRFSRSLASSLGFGVFFSPTLPFRFRSSSQAFARPFMLFRKTSKKPPKISAQVTGKLSGMSHFQ